MLFLTYWFVYFIAALYPLYWVCRWRPARLLILLAGCVVFHTHFAGPAGVIPIIVLSVLTYLIGLTRNRALCGVGIFASASALIFYKYTKFVCTQLLVHAWPSLAASSSASPPWFQSIAAPLAISFFAFEFIHYLLEIYRGAKPMRNPLDFALFTLFWPSIVAGPVKRYHEFIPALYHGVDTVGGQDVAEGLLRVALGLVKKFAADILTGWLKASYLQFESGQFDPLWRWGFVGALSLRILWDFSGYSDMAIGFARMHGVRLPRNFHWPYLAENLTDFWRRWHISLSSWIRDYVYIVLGGNRGGPVSKVVNGVLAFAICGLWHGADWNFLVWGVYHGMGLAVCSSYRRMLGPAGEFLAGLMARRKPLAWGLTMAYVGVGWLLFFYPLHDAWRMIRVLFCLR
jgi:alginate O-acetyltransferase complex protein AlgI